ncbi:MAG: RNA polymerase sigma-70 factor [Vicinamibacterales bacterium]
MSEDVFTTGRALLFSVAYRMLGSASDAEDVLQDAWLRYRAADRSDVRSPQAFATTIVTRLCLDRLKSARATRETYIGPWLPEPILTDQEAGPDGLVERSETVTLAFLVLLEALSPEERAVLLLKDVFGHGHAEIADILGTSADNSRQLLHRARSRLAEGRPRLAGTAGARRAVAERFARAFTAGDGAELTAMLTQDVTIWSDGGGKATAARRPLVGRDRVVAFLVGLHRTAQTAGLASEASMAIEEVNAEPALVLRVGGRLESIFVLSVEADAVTGVRVVRNPDKLAHIDHRLATRH